MDTPSISVLIPILLVLILSSTFFSASETGMMAINRYRLKHAARLSKTAKRVSELLKSTDKLLGAILIGNTFANILASSIATLIAMQLWGEVGIFIASIFLTLILLIFGEILPKTLAASHPDKVAYATSLPLKIFLKIIYPVVWLLSTTSNGILKIFGINLKSSSKDYLSREELRTVVNEAGSLIPNRHKRMLISILDLEKATVEDIMIPRNEVIGIDISADWESIVNQLSNSQHTLLPIYNQDLENVSGILHARSAIRTLADPDSNKQTLENAASKPYFVPESTPLHIQLLNFQNQKQRLALVVDEYGVIKGLITLEDILEEIVGQFTTDITHISKDVHPQADGSFIVDGSANLRALNRSMKWELPTSGPKTLNGLILEYLEAIPNEGTCILLNGYPIEVLQVIDNAVKSAKISNRLQD